MGTERNTVSGYDDRVVSDFARLLEDDAQRLMATGFVPSACHVVVMVASGPGSVEPSAAMARVAGRLRARLTPAGRNVVLREGRARAVGVCGLDEAAGYGQLIAEIDRVLCELSRRERVLVAAAGRPVAGTAGIIDSYRQAARALDQRMRIRQRAPTLTFDDAVAYEVIRASPAWAAELMAPIRPLLDGASPAERSELLDVLQAYLDTSGNVLAAAELVTMGRRTFYRRLQRIGELLESDRADGRVRFRLELGLRAYRLWDGKL
ncbi:MAG TPA: helix-turn-helix domain-containing protein [Actinomycetota bacterium]